MNVNFDGPSRYGAVLGMPWGRGQIENELGEEGKIKTWLHKR